jgi:hypothetical protein
MTPEAHADHDPGQDSQPSWHYARFRIRRDGQGDVNSHIDLYIADQLVAPILADSEEAIALWRFHRRWPRDRTGHQFSFIFLAPSDVASAIDKSLRNSSTLSDLEADGYLREYRLDSPHAEAGSDPAATSDPVWPADIQSTWPEFIMGASRMWLALVQAKSAGLTDKPDTDAYRSIESEIDELWFNHGNHALFHHLSALFGYKPLEVKRIRRDVMTF